MKHLSKDATHGLQLTATSIFGEGDKIALPPSVLETLTRSLLFSEDNNNHQQLQRQQQQPWTFRVGILNPDYTFPASPLMQNIPVDDGESSFHDGDNDDDDDDDEEQSKTAIYLDELRQKYRAYTHATVVEFTQEEGQVGLPEPIARALLRQASNLETTRTVDKATAASVAPILENEIITDNYSTLPMEIDPHQDQYTNEDIEKTPGHLAWGAFDVPVDKIEITMVQLPKGRTAKLLPSQEAIRNGFYALKDIKMVLEQSLIRTRATLSVGDLIHTWHRGQKFDLTVTQVTPAAYQSVSCINTDIEIDFEAPETNSQPDTSSSSSAAAAAAVPDSMGIPLGGRRLGESSSSSMAATAVAAAATTTTTTPLTSVPASASSPVLPPEPPADQKEGVVSVQIRSSTAKGQRRLDVRTATVRDLFTLATSLGAGDDATAFRLVTRFPRRVFSLDGHNADQTLEQAGILSGQELFMVEKL